MVILLDAASLTSTRLLLVVLVPRYAIDDPDLKISLSP
jgi:hypothetical protein